MSFTSPPVWRNRGVEPPSELKVDGFSAGYKPPASYFNWFWNRVSVCLAELQSASSEGSSVNAKEITVSKDGWVTDSTSGLYKLEITDEAITAESVVELNLDLVSLNTATNCGLKSVTESYEGYFCIYAESVPEFDMTGTLVIQGAASAVPLNALSANGVYLTVEEK